MKTTFNPTGVPKQLIQYANFVLWCEEEREGRKTKVPYQFDGSHAKVNSRQTWTSYYEAEQAWRSGRFDGIGFCLSEGTPIGIDLDHCRCPAFPETEIIAPWAKDIISKIDSYTEASPSGKGIRIFAYGGKLPEHGRNKKLPQYAGDNCSKDAVPAFEIYEEGRYLTVTGNHIVGTPTDIMSRPDIIDAVYKEMFGDTTTGDAKPEIVEPAANSSAGDLLRKAFSSKNGVKIQSLYNGNYSGYGSQSEADLALCSHLAFWFDGDAAAIDAAFRQSGLMRDKWDKKHHGDGRTYGAATIERAVCDCHNFYSDHLSEKNEKEIEQNVPLSLTWPDPLPLPDALPPVEPFDMELLPSTLKPWASDITERFQCPPDFVGAAIMAALASVVGRKIGIRPQAQTDWTTVPNLWAFLVGRSGVMKSPAMEAALAPLKRLAAQAGEAFQVEQAEYQRKALLLKIQSEEAEKAARAMLKKNPRADVEELLTLGEIEKPSLRRYIANDTTVAALGELLRHNQNGFLVYRDEMVSLLKGLDREDAAGDRGFYLTAWNGDSSHTVDRIGRGLNLYIPAVCLSLLGSTQPGRIAEYIRHAVKGTSSDDGLIQRFSMLVWPDMCSDWKDIDRWPDHEAKQRANGVFEYLDKLNPLDIGAVQDNGLNGEPIGIPYLRFDDAGRELFLEWRTTLEKNLRGGDLPPALESHFSKYRKLIPAIALLIHLADGKSGPVGVESVLSALAWGEYLETHARRAYASITTPDVATSKAILLKLKRGEINVPFRARDIYRKGWSGLAEPERVRDALTFLEDRDWLASSTIPPSVHGGRPQVTYMANPRCML